MSRLIFISFTIFALFGATLVSTNKTTDLLGHLVEVHQGFDHHHGHESHTHSHEENEPKSGEASHSHSFDFSLISQAFIFEYAVFEVPEPVEAILDGIKVLSTALIPKTFHASPFRPPITA